MVREPNHTNRQRVRQSGEDMRRIGQIIDPGDRERLEGGIPDDDIPAMVASQIVNHISQGSADEHQTTLHPCGNGSRVHAIDRTGTLRPDGNLVAGGQTNGLVRSPLSIGNQDRTAQHGDLHIGLAILD